MNENMLKRIYSNPLLLTLFLFPVFFVFILTCIGFYFGTHQFYLGVIADQLHEKSTIVKAVYPDTDFKIGPVGSYRMAKMYYLKNGEEYEVSFFDGFSTNDLDTLSAIVSKNVTGERKGALLKQIDSFRFFSWIEKKVNRVRLDWIPVLIGLFLYTTLFHNFGRRILIILIWYTFCYFMATFGYFAHWLLPFRQPHTPYLFGFYDEYTHAFSEQIFSTGLLIEVFVIIPGLYLLKYLIVSIYPKGVLMFRKIRGSNKF